MTKPGDATRFGTGASSDRAAFAGRGGYAEPPRQVTRVTAKHDAAWRDAEVDDGWWDDAVPSLGGVVKAVVEMLLSGVANGAVYALLAVGMGLVYGVTRVFNWAYGSLFVWGAYVAWSLTGAGLPYLVALPLVAIAMFVVGAAVEQFTIRPLRSGSSWQAMTMVVTLGVAIALDSLALIVFGPYMKSLPPLFHGGFIIAGVAVSHSEVFTLSAAVGLVVLLEVFSSRTRLGQTMQAVAQDAFGARMVGINVDAVFTAAFALSSASVGICGVLLAHKYFITPSGGWDVLVKVWVVLSLGGLGSTKGMIIAAFLLAMVEAVVSWQFGAMWIMVVWFGVLLVVLAVRPRGLFGRWE